MTQPIAIHFVGFTGDEFWSAVKILGRPNFIHPQHDPRSRQEIAPGDIVIFATGDEHQPVSRHNVVDYIEKGTEA